MNKLVTLFLKVTTLAIVLMFFFIFFSNAQNLEWAPVGATWHYSQTQVSPPWTNPFLKFQSVKDTTLNGKEARVMEESLNGETMLNEYVMYGDSNKVFIYDTASLSFKSVYDFWAETGDTFTTHIPVGSGMKSTKVRVDSTDSVTINNIRLKRQYVSAAGNGEFVMYGEVIQNIGWKPYMFAHSALVDPPPGGSLRCYEDTVIGLYNTGDQKVCDTTYTENPSPLGDWAPIGVKWYYSAEEIGMTLPSPYSEGYIMIESVSDTTIDSITARKLEFTHVWSDGSSKKVRNEYTYEADGIVHVWRKYQFRQLYNFNLLAGDTLILPGDGNHCSDTGYVLINEVTDHKVNEIMFTTLKSFQVSQLENSDWNFNGDILENIGSLDFLLPHKGCIADNIDEWEGSGLRCYVPYKDGPITLYFNGYGPNKPCDYLYVNSIIEDPYFNFEVYPNPFRDQIIIDVEPSLNELEIKIQNIYGKEVTGKIFISNNYYKKELDLSELPSGPYFIQLITGQQTLTKQIVKID